MNILYLHQHFALPSGSTGTRSYEFARRWVAAGHNVTVICGRGDICGLPEQSEFQMEGIDIRVVGVPYSQKQSFLRRLWSFIQFMRAASFCGLRQKEADIIFATSTPLTIGIPAMLISRIKRIPFVFEVRDQWPEVPIEMGIIRNPVLKKLLLVLEKRIYCRASAIVALSPGMADGVRQVLGKIDKPIRIVSNSADIDLFSPEMDGSGVRRKLGLQDKFVILHFGTMGRANGLDFLMEAAELLRPQSDVVFALMGSGREMQLLQQKAASVGLNNMVFLGRQSKRDLPAWVAACDVSTVIFAKFPILEHNSANKFFDSLAAGRPVLLNYSGWQRELIEKHGAGVGCPQCDVAEYVQKVKLLISRKDQLKDMGQNARTLAETMFSRDKLAAEVLDLLNEVHTRHSERM